MIAYRIRTSNPSAYYPAEPDDPPLYYMVKDVGSIGSDRVLDILHTSDPTNPGDDLIIAWDINGDPIGPVNLALYQAHTPLGNYPPRDLYDENGDLIGQTRGGEATRALKSHNLAGWAQHKLEGGELYPADNSPFTIEIRHKYFGGNADPAWDSYGWRAEIIGDYGNRDPSGYAIGIYRDAECTDYWYTTGAFSAQESEWQVDSEGNTLTVWATEYNQGLLGEPTPVPVDHHHAVLLGSAQEGYETLAADREASTHLFWEQTQPGAASQPQTGPLATVIAIVGAGVYQVDDTAAFAGMAGGMPLTVGGVPTTFTRVHQAGAPGIIVVSSHNASAVGTEIGLA